ncbi:MAG: outer membrane beta-barrel protein [Bacteroidetes bacterium]|nr:outer membrane beta-barrel protein [Bacteroidota bacterium]
MRNKVLQGSSPIFSSHLGLGITMPLNHLKKISISEEIGFIKKGYHQNIGGDKFEMRFTYFNGQTILNYKLKPWVSAKVGVNYAVLINANIKKSTETYRPLDIGLVGGFNFLETKDISFYAHVVYGLVPMLKYYNIDATGNFNGTINDLKNTCIMVGFKIKLYDQNKP